MGKMINSINWFEIPVLNFDRAKDFYSRIYNYKMHETVMNSGRMGFLPMDHESQGVGGAIVQETDDVPTALGVKVYLNGGKDLQQLLDRVVSAEGEVLTNKTLITEKIGYFAVFEDTEWNHISLHSKE